MVSLVVLFGGALASATSGRDSGTRVALVAAAQPASPSGQLPPLPIPTADPAPCSPGSPPLPVCTLPRPTTTLPPCDPTLPLQQCAPATTTPSTPCSGEGCIPQPGTTTTPPTNPGNGQPGQGQATEDDCGITDIGACVTEAINGFFRGLVTEALNPLLDLLSTTLLTTPMPDSLPRVVELWDNSWQILLVSYSLLVLIAGVIAISYQSLQTRHSIKELAPRLVVGFLAGALSLWVATKGIQIANAVVEDVMDGGVDAESASQTLRNMVVNSTTQGGVWIALIGIVLAGLLVALLITYAVRVAVTIILIGGAPLAMMFHALSQTEGVAYWWWKTYGGCLAIQVGQSLALITALKVFLAPGGFGLFGPTDTGLVNLLVAIALIYILFKIPFWVMSSIRGGGGRSLLGSLVKGFLAYKTFGLLGGRGNQTPRQAVPRSRPTRSREPAPPPPVSTSCPCPECAESARAPRSPPRPQPQKAKLNRETRPRSKARPRRRRLRFRESSWRCRWAMTGRRTSRCLDVTASTGCRWTSSAPRPLRRRVVVQPRVVRVRRVAAALSWSCRSFKGNHPTGSGQYPLPLDGVRRVPRPTSPPSPPPPAPPRARNRVVQPELPFDPYKGNRATRDGQYLLPLKGVRPVPVPKPAPVPPPAAPARPAPRAGRQLRLPLDLPKPSKPATTPVLSSPPIPPPAVPPRPKPGGKTP